MSLTVRVLTMNLLRWFLSRVILWSCHKWNTLHGIKCNFLQFERHEWRTKIAQNSMTKVQTLISYLRPRAGQGRFQSCWAILIESRLFFASVSIRFNSEETFFPVAEISSLRITGKLSTTVVNIKCVSFIRWLFIVYQKSAGTHSGRKR